MAKERGRKWPCERKVLQRAAFCKAKVLGMTQQSDELMT
jgi:hypothetical protein